MQTKGSRWEPGERRSITSQGSKEKSEIVKDVLGKYTQAGHGVLDRRNSLSKGLALYKIQCAVAPASKPGWLETWGGGVE